MGLVILKVWLIPVGSFSKLFRARCARWKATITIVEVPGSIHQIPLCSGNISIYVNGDSIWTCVGKASTAWSSSDIASIDKTFSSSAFRWIFCGMAFNRIVNTNVLYVYLVANTHHQCRHWTQQEKGVDNVWQVFFLHTTCCEGRSSDLQTEHGTLQHLTAVH